MCAGIQCKSSIALQRFSCTLRGRPRSTRIVVASRAATAWRPSVGRRGGGPFDGEPRACRRPARLALDLPFRLLVLLLAIAASCSSPPTRKPEAPPVPFGSLYRAFYCARGEWPRDLEELQRFASERPGAQTYDWRCTPGRTSRRTRTESFSSGSIHTPSDYMTKILAETMVRPSVWSRSKRQGVSTESPRSPMPNRRRRRSSRSRTDPRASTR